MRNKLFILVCVMIVSCSMIGCGKSVASSYEAGISTAENSILLERNDLEIIYIKYDPSGLKGATIELLIKNNKNKEVRVKLSDEVVNGLQFNDSVNDTIEAHSEKYFYFF